MERGNESPEISVALQSFLESNLKAFRRPR